MVASSALGYEKGPARDAVCRLADAQGLIPPFTGHGMAMAFQSAETALPRLLDYARGRESWEITVDHMGRDLEARLSDLRATEQALAASEATKDELAKRNESLERSANEAQKELRDAARTIGRAEAEVAKLKGRLEGIQPLLKKFGIKLD